MSPWLITWDTSGEVIGSTIPNRIAAILPNRTGEETVEKIMHLLMANYAAHPGLSDRTYVSEQLRFARGNSPHRIQRSMFGTLYLFGNPGLKARRVHNVKVVKPSDAEEELHWDEVVHPAIDLAGDVDKQVRLATPFKRRKMKYRSESNEIVYGETFQPRMKS